MADIYLYAHGGSGNHGCEAIVRSTAYILEKEGLHLISSNPQEDTFYGLNEIVDILLDTDGNISHKSLAFLKAYASLKIKKDFIPMDKLRYRAAFGRIRKGDVALSIGGDNYCYADVYKYTMLHDMAKQSGAKTVLWGCSVEPDVAKRPEIAADLARYDLITARESITYDVLKTLNPNTVMVADPAFCLESKEKVLPAGFLPGNTLGLNLSPMAMGCESIAGIAMENYVRLMEYVLENTKLHIALIPHVVWQDGDDRVPLQKLFQLFTDSGRVSMIKDCECRELKYLIGQCRFFIGARTHATIAAYSSCVPTLTVGYSVKARGIARDLFGTEDNFVLPVQELTDADALTAQFCWLLTHEGQIRSHLANILPQYIQRGLSAKAAVDHLLR